jgi:uncharacterized protein (DUF1697 family)
MPRYIALLRGINVGGHRVKMTDLKQHFEELGFTGVETFIASGNVVFDSPETSSAALEKEIEDHLLIRLGYQVPTFIRTPAEIAEVAALQPFPPGAGIGEGKETLSVMFVREEVAPDVRDKLSSLQTEKDWLCAHGREIYWLCASRTSDSLIDWPKVGKQLSFPLTTVRNVTTVRRLTEKYPPA